MKRIFFIITLCTVFTAVSPASNTPPAVTDLNRITNGLAAITELYQTSAVPTVERKDDLGAVACLLQPGNEEALIDYVARKHEQRRFDAMAVVNAINEATQDSANPSKAKAVLALKVCTAQGTRAPNLTSYKKVTKAVENWQHASGATDIQVMLDDTDQDYAAHFALDQAAAQSAKLLRKPARSPGRLFSRLRRSRTTSQTEEPNDSASDGAQSDDSQQGFLSGPGTPIKKSLMKWSTENSSLENKLQGVGVSIGILKAIDAPIRFGAHVAKVNALATGKPLQKAHTPAASVIPATLRALFDIVTPITIAAQAIAQHKKGTGMGAKTGLAMAMGWLTSGVVLVNLILHGVANKTLHLKGARLQAFRAGVQAYTKGLGTWAATQIGLGGVMLTIDELLAIITADSWRRGHQDMIDANNKATSRYVIICLLTIAKHLLDIGTRIPQVSMVNEMINRGAPIVGMGPLIA